MLRKKQRALFIVFAIVVLAPSALGWNATGHKVVAAIAWDNMSPAARQQTVALLKEAPSDACLLDLFPENGALADRQREFFILASTWPDIVRPDDDDTRPCTRFHERNWHFINFFWQGTSDGTGADAPQDRDDFEIAPINAVERLGWFRPLVVCDIAQCGTNAEVRATTLAWIVHLVGDIHQPLHTSARLTSHDPEGDQGGNLFKLERGQNARSLHSYWDGILNRAAPRQATEGDGAYVSRLATMIAQEHPRASMTARILSGDFDAWSLESFEDAKRVAYPRALRFRHMPDSTYETTAFTTSKEAIALAGYRLADLLNRMFP